MFLKILLLGSLQMLVPLVRALSVHEVHTALEGMARGKFPGSDGLPMEFYLTFWDSSGSDLTWY